MQANMERQSDEERRMIFLDGKAAAATLSRALRKRVRAVPSYEDRFQCCIGCDEYGDGRVVLATRETLDSDLHGAVHITLTTNGLDDALFAAARDDWWTWWCRQVDSPEVAVG